MDFVCKFLVLTEILGLAQIYCCCFFFNQLYLIKNLFYSRLILQDKCYDLSFSSRWTLRVEFYGSFKIKTFEELLLLSCTKMMDIVIEVKNNFTFVSTMIYFIVCFSNDSRNDRWWFEMSVVGTFSTSILISGWHVQYWNNFWIVICCLGNFWSTFL